MPIALRVVESVKAMTAQVLYLPNKVLRKISTELTSKVDGCNRVLFDITSKPPGTIEFE